MKYCEGCRTRERHCTIRVYIKYAMKEITSTMNECPCGMCLIKGICKAACEDYLKFSTAER